MTSNFIFVGDVHGQFKKLTELMDAVDFIPDDPMSTASDSKMIFVGDLIDNVAQQGVDQLATLTLVRSLCERNLAICLLGNHEFNAIGWWLRHPQTGQPLRQHSNDNKHQHQLFLEEVEEDSATHADWARWFMTLPLFLDLGEVRAIHACWDRTVIAQIRPYLNSDNSLKAEFWPDAFNPQHELHDFCEILLKGPEIGLPEGFGFHDKRGKFRQQIRVSWWQDSARTYRELAQVPSASRTAIPDVPLPDAIRPLAQELPVVVGHYTLSGMPELLSEKVICVDYNAAAEDEPLVSYLWFTDNQKPHCPDACHFFWSDQPHFSREAEAGMSQWLANIVEPLEWPHHKPEQLELFCTEVRKILWQHWDPSGVFGIEACRDEYDGYVSDIVKLVFASGSERQLIGGYLLGLELAYFGGETDSERCGRAAVYLMAARDSWLATQVS
ncbi:metallophosphoesterase [Pseudaeromonas sp. ZJS20]|uniref:metallophosphoesterase n=1 Tax=Pseudaeromonas aegiceratis TaxID=3153928 RepID=UPI00390CB9F7